MTDHTRTRCFNTVLRGAALAPGVALGTAYLYRDIFDAERGVRMIRPDAVLDEYSRLEEAVREVHQDLSLCAERIEQDLDRGLADIFRTHQEMLHDPALTAQIKGRLEKDLVNAEHAVQCVLREWENKFLAMKDIRFRRRGADIADLGRRLLRKLAGVRGHSLELMPAGSVLIASRLLPSETVFLSRRSAQGVVVAIGGAASHCALLTRGMGIPAVAQIDGLFDTITAGDTIIVDGNRGVVTVSPDQTTLAAARVESEQYALLADKARRSAQTSSITLDGVRIPVMANIADREDAERAAANGADGIGLYRIEAFYLGSNVLPSEAEIHEELSQTLAHFRDKPVCVRLLDVGGDKSLPYLRLPLESNPFLGRRGVRLLLDYPELLSTQLRALLKLSEAHDLSILVPMVTFPDDIKHVRDALLAVADELAIPAPPLGAMIETPAAAFCAAEIATYADFISVGTNDLAQYALAADRGNPLVSRYYQDDHDSIFKMLAMISERVHPKPVAVCGELASREHAIPALLKAGVRILSAAAPLVPMVKQSVRHAHAEV